MIVAVLLLFVFATIMTRVKRSEEVDTIPDEQKIARTLEIIRTSTPSNRKVLKVLFYGQSITRSGWEGAVLDHWAQRYPNTVFEFQNRAIGGFDALQLVRTTGQDITAFYPDLIVFHVYGNHHAYEDIIRLLRSHTAADVILQTDHGDLLPDLPCREGLRLSLQKQPGCRGTLWLTQREWHDEMSYHKIPAFGRKYGVAVEPQRGWWRTYLLRNHLAASSLLVDDIHPNAQGKALLAAFFNQYFDDLVDRWHGETEQNVTSVPFDLARLNQQSATFSFEGSRVELLSTRPLAQLPSVSVDGGAPKDMDGCYQATRASSIETVPDWPALRQVALHKDHVAEEWVATISHVTPDQTYFTFAVKGSVSGDDGTGDAHHDFRSKTGNVSIETDDWMVGRAFESSHTPLPDPFFLHWSVQYVCGNTPEVIDLGNGSMQYRYVLATGISNTTHVLTLTAASDVPLGSALANATELRTYRPPLHAD
jgi:hypothetical protein